MYKADPNDNTKQVPNNKPNSFYGNGVLPEPGELHKAPAFVLINTTGSFNFSYNTSHSIGGKIFDSKHELVPSQPNDDLYQKAMVIRGINQGPIRLDINPNSWTGSAPILSSTAGSGSVKFVFDPTGSVTRHSNNAVSERIIIDDVTFNFVVSSSGYTNSSSLDKEKAIYIERTAEAGDGTGPSYQSGSAKAFRDAINNNMGLHNLNLSASLVKSTADTITGSANIVKLFGNESGSGGNYTITTSSIEEINTFRITSGSTAMGVFGGSTTRRGTLKKGDVTFVYIGGS